jgi:RES domain-containing protein
MKIYRTTPLQFAAPKAIFTGIGAAEYPGRWNLRDQRVIYCSNSLSASISERSFHSIQPKIEIYNNELKVRNGRVIASYYEDLLDVKFNLAEIEINNNGILDITSDVALKEVLLRSKMDMKNVSDCRVHKYEFAKPSFWTRKLSNFIQQEGYNGFLVPSARSNLGSTVVIFENSAEHTEARFNYITTVSISALNASSNNKIKNGVKAQFDKVAYTSILGNGFAEILKF